MAKEKDVYTLVAELREEIADLNVRLRDLEKKVYVNPNPLTDKQENVLILMCRGLGNEEIAQVLCIEYGTVSSHISHINDRLDTTGVRKAMAWGFKNLRGV